MSAENASPPVGPSGASNSTADAVSDQISQVRAAASSLLDKGQSSSSVMEFAASVEKAAGALKQAAEMDKTRQELEKLTQEILKLQLENKSAAKRERSERTRDYVALLTPLVTIITLASTLIVQNWQFLRSERDKQVDALDAQWRDAEKAVSSSGALSAGVVALQPFLGSEKYGDRAHEAAANLLINSSDPAFFTSLFGSAFTPVTQANLDRVIRLNRALRVRADLVFAKSWDDKRQASDMKRLSKQEVATYDYVTTVFPTITSQIVGVLRTRPPEVKIDLSGVFLYDSDLAKINLKGVNLENSEVTGCNFQGAELEGVTQFSGMTLYVTNWWEARSINRPLFDYLRGSTSFSPKVQYGPNAVLVTQKEYDRAIQRLSSGLK